MGQIISLEFELIKPGEDFLHETPLARVIRIPKEKLLPVPVRKIDDSYVHMDGRHRLIWHYLNGEKSVMCFLCDEHTDLMHNAQFPNFSTEELDDNNYFITHRWDLSAEISDILGAKNYHEHFKTLQERYTFLKNPDFCREYLKSQGLLV